MEYVYKHDRDKPILFMLMGLSGSGKSYLAESLSVIRNNENIIPVIHSSDELRKELYNNINDQNHNSELFNELHKRIKNDLNKGKDVIYDATNISKKRRIAFLRQIANIDCYKVCCCILTPYEVCLQQNHNRVRKVPDNAIKRMYLNWCPPAYNEGFDDIILIYNYGNANKNKYTLKNFFQGEINADAIEQENNHHTATIGIHCREAMEYVNRHYANPTLEMAALLHDIGKPFTKSHLNFKGKTDSECHYYNHNNCGAYDSFFYLDNLNYCVNEKLHIANLIYYHMILFTFGQQNKSTENKLRAQIGENFYNELLQLHEADLASH